MTPSDRLRAMAEEEEKRADELEASLPAIREAIEGHRAGAAELRKMADGMDRRLARLQRESGPIHWGLSSIAKKGTLGVPKMEAESASRGAKVSIARTKSSWPFRQALHRRNLSLPEWARSQKGITVEAAKSWLKAPSGGGRPIPLVWAERIAKEFVSDETGTTEVPPVDASWPNGIR